MDIAGSSAINILMPQPTPKPAVDIKSISVAGKPISADDHLKIQEKKALAKLDRIKSWPKEHQSAAIERAQAKLSQIREAKKKIDK